MINILVIDDEFSRLEKILNYIKKHYKFEFEVSHIETFQLTALNDADIVFLDHDLGAGGDVYEHLKTHADSINWENKQFIIHSMNPVGANNMMRLIQDYTRNVFKVPFSNL